MTWLLNSSEPKTFRIVVLLIILVQCSFVIHQMAMAASGRLFNAATAITVLLVAVGLYRRVRWARMVSVIFLWGVILIAFGLLSPFRVSDEMMAGIETPPLTELVIQFAIVCALSLWCLHVLGKYKAAFRRAWL